MEQTPKNEFPAVVQSRESTLPEYEELLKAAKAATPGPWSYLLRKGVDLIYSPTDCILGSEQYYPWVPDSQTIQFIALANPAAVIELIAALTAARAQVAAQQPYCDSLRKRNDELSASLEHRTLVMGEAITARNQRAAKMWREKSEELTAQIAELNQQILVIQANASDNYAAAENRTHAVEAELASLKQQSRWISVRTELPPEGRLVLVFTPHWSSQPTVGYRHRGKWCAECILSEPDGVTHWMALVVPSYAAPAKETAEEAWERGQIKMRDDLAEMFDDQIEWASTLGSLKNASTFPYAAPAKETTA